MDYQVWIKDEYGDTWTKVDCGDLPAAKREIDIAYREGKAPLLTIEVPYELSIKIGEASSEVKKSTTRPDKMAGPESESEVRPGDTPAVQKLNQ